MDYSEKSEYFTQEEIVFLKKKTQTMNIVLSIVTAFFSTIMYFMVFTSDFIPAKIFGVLFILFPLGIIFYVNFTLKKELQNGKKLIITGTIADKYEIVKSTRSSSSNSSTKTSYFFKIGAKEIDVDYNNYKLFQNGDDIEISITQLNKTILSVKPLSVQQNANAFTSQKRENANTFLDNAQVENKSFEYNETIDYMTDEEVRTILKKRNSRAIKTGILLVITGYIAYKILNIIFVLFLIFVGVNKSGIYQTSGMLAFISVLALSIYIFYKRLIDLQTDYKQQNKAIITTQIADKVKSNVRIMSNSIRITSSRGEYFYIIILNKYYSIDYSIYEKIKTGEKVELHRGIYSKTPLRIKCKESNVEIPIF